MSRRWRRGWPPRHRADGRRRRRLHDHTRVRAQATSASTTARAANLYMGASSRTRPSTSSTRARGCSAWRTPVKVCVEINRCVGCSATTRPSWLRRAVRKRHRHAIEQASRRWRGGRRDDSARTRPRRSSPLAATRRCARRTSAERTLRGRVDGAENTLCTRSRKSKLRSLTAPHRPVVLVVGRFGGAGVGLGPRLG